MGKTIAVLLTCHNRKAETVRCLEFIARQKLLEDIAVQVYLVDDGSTDGTAAAVKEVCPKAILLQGNGSLYWGGGMRQAFAEAMKDGYDFYLWLNDDVTLAENALNFMVTTYQALVSTGHSKSILVGSTKDPQIGELTYGGWRMGSWPRPLHFNAVVPSGTMQPCDAMNGNCVLIPQEVARLVGNIDSTFTHTMGDFDYALRARKKGCAVWVVPGYIGTCTRNSSEGSWRDPDASFSERVERVQDPKHGLPFREWRIFVRRHGGFFWFLTWFFSYRKLLGIP